AKKTSPNPQPSKKSKKKNKRKKSHQKQPITPTLLPPWAMLLTRTTQPQKPKPNKLPRASPFTLSPTRSTRHIHLLGRELPLARRVTGADSMMAWRFRVACEKRHEAV